MTQTSSQPCVLHHSHGPFPTYTELHHLVPQAWQAHWQPARPWPSEGRSPDRPGLQLWDNRAMAICRTGHGNVHHWIVALMHAYQADTVSGDERARQRIARQRVLTAERAAHMRVSYADLDTAALALSRFTDVGGSLADLIAHGLWGEI